MNFLVFNGSPKGDLSVTMQYVKFLKKKHKEHTFEIINIAQSIKKIENNNGYFEEIIDKVKQSIGVIWAFPLYYTAAHANYHRFIEILFEKNKTPDFKDKYAFAITTSIHFFDNIAHNYIESICKDLKMKFAGSYSASMQDLFDKNKRENFSKFADNVFENINKGIFKPNAVQEEVYNPVNYTTGDIKEKINAGNKRVVIISDVENQGSNLGKIVNTIQNLITGNVKVYNLHDIDIKGGCNGCLACGYAYECIYTGQDAYIPFFKQAVVPSDIVIFAMNIKHRFLSSKWKTFFDRMFFNTHTPAFTNKQIGFIFSGPLKSNPNIIEALQGIMQWNGSNINAFLSDEAESSESLDKNVKDMVWLCVNNSESNYVSPMTFPGVGGMKIFRDHLYSQIKFPFRADHKYFKKNGLYKFPKKSLGISLFLSLLKIFPGLRKKIYTPKFMKNGMIRRYEKLLKKIYN